MTNAQLKYAQEHNLTDTLISLQVLRQCRPELEWVIEDNEDDD